MNLLDCPLRTAVRIKAASSLDDKTFFRLCELGLRPGAIVSVTQKGGFGGRVVASGHQRFALDKATARALGCDPCGHEYGTEPTRQASSAAERVRKTRSTRDAEAPQAVGA